MATVDSPDPKFDAYWNVPSVGFAYTQHGVSKDSVKAWFDSLSPWQQDAELNNVQGGNSPTAPMTSDVGSLAQASLSGFNLGDPTARQQWTDQVNGIAALGLPPGTQITRNGQVIAGGLQEPGAVAAVQSNLAAARANQLANVNGYNSGLQGVTNNLSNSDNAINANDAALLDAYSNSLSGINIPNSQAAQAFADPSSIAAQQQAQQLLAAAGMGSMDAHSNPADVARQSQAADKLWGLTDPTMTAQERFLMAQAQQNEERDRRAAMDAALQNLAGRGMLGSGGEIGAMLGAQQTTSNNRMMADLGAQANAVGRAQNALGLYSNLATGMRNASDAMATGNSNRQLSAADASSAAAAQLRNSSFNEAFSRGGAADATAQAQANLGLNKAQGIANTGLAVSNAETNRVQNLSNTATANLQNAFNATSGLNATDAQWTVDDYNRRLQAIKDSIDAAKTSAAIQQGQLATR